VLTHNGTAGENRGGAQSKRKQFQEKKRQCPPCEHTRGGKKKTSGPFRRRGTHSGISKSRAGPNGGASIGDPVDLREGWVGEKKKRPIQILRPQGLNAPGERKKLKGEKKKIKKNVIFRLEKGGIRPTTTGERISLHGEKKGIKKRKKKKLNKKG